MQPITETIAVTDVEIVTEPNGVACISLIVTIVLAVSSIYCFHAAFREIGRFTREWCETWHGPDG